MTDCYIPAKDGITHINIFSRGQTKLGQLLSNFAHTPIEIPELGRFESLEGLWYYLLTENEELRKLYGFKAKQLGKGLSRVPRINQSDDLFRSQIKKAMRIKVNTYPEIKSMLKSSDLPFTHYYVFNGIKKDAGFSWIVQEWELIRKELKGKL